MFVFDSWHNILVEGLNYNQLTRDIHVVSTLLEKRQ